MTPEPRAEIPAEVVVETALLDEIRKAAAAAYPNEGCGALLGRRDGEPTVTATIPLPNVEEGTPRVRFSISPRHYMDVEREAERRGLELLGFWHSHPDHPARPSATDREFAWEGLLTLIVSVHDGEPRDVGVFQVPRAGAPFAAMRIFERSRAVGADDPASESTPGGF